MKLATAGTQIVDRCRSVKDGGGACGPFSSTKQIGRRHKAVTLCTRPAHEIAGVVHVPEQGTDIGTMFDGIAFRGGMRGPVMGRVRRSLLRSNGFVSGVRVTAGTGLSDAAS